MSPPTRLVTSDGHEMQFQVRAPLTGAARPHPQRALLHWHAPPCVWSCACAQISNLPHCRAPQVNFLSHFLLSHELLAEQRQRRAAQRRTRARHEAGARRGGTRVVLLSSLTHYAGPVQWEDKQVRRAALLMRVRGQQQFRVCVCACLCLFRARRRPGNMPFCCGEPTSACARKRSRSAPTRPSRPTHSQRWRTRWPRSSCSGAWTGSRHGGAQLGSMFSCARATPHSPAYASAHALKPSSVWPSRPGRADPPAPFQQERGAVRRRRQRAERAPRDCAYRAGDGLLRADGLVGAALGRGGGARRHAAAVPPGAAQVRRRARGPGPCAAKGNESEGRWR